MIHESSPSITTMHNLQNHSRHSIRLQEYDYSQPREYFVTICTKDRECILGEIIGNNTYLSEYGIIVQKHWTNISGYHANIELDEFVVMPNHIHGIITITEPVGAIHESPLPIKNKQQLKSQYERRIMTLPKIIGRFKMITAKNINLLRDTPGFPVW